MAANLLQLRFDWLRRIITFCVMEMSAGSEAV